jgi:hypothetical protein
MMLLILLPIRNRNKLDAAVLYTKVATRTVRAVLSPLDKLGCQ